MTKAELRKIVSELQDDGPFLTDEAYDIAGNILFEEKGMAEAIKIHYNAIDAQGWLMNQIV